MEEEFTSSAAKRRGNAGVGAGYAPLHNHTFPHLTAPFMCSDECAGERTKLQHELSNAANEFAVSSLLTWPLLFMARTWAPASLEHRAHASATPDPHLPCPKCPASSDATAKTRYRQSFLHVGKRRPLRLVMVMAVAACILFLSLIVLLFRGSALPLKPRGVLNITTLQPMKELRGRAQGTGVLVQHEDAVSRLNLTAAQRACIVAGAAYGACGLVHLSANELPSWTLRVVERDCADCMDTYTYRTTVKGVRLHKRHGVYATSSAPLGRVGPMLLAMTSVTDDVNVRTELPQWEWLRHVYGEGFPTVGGAGEGAAQPRRPYLAVMGIPSTDQPARAALREAQRRTWLTYQEVARTENHFDAALLALYVFAAVEPKAAPGASESSSASTRNGTSAAEPRRGRLSALLPTTTEYKAATEALLTATAQAEGIGDLAAEGIVQRRMELRRDWNIAAVEDTPCADVISRRVTVGAETSALLYLSGALSLPVTPAFTSPAEYVCHASSALWQEALTHRNVVWIDMMTDRRPTTNKKLGEDGKWGLPVEVGMSQKLILWLEYAYHAFKNVPFIIKGDDDSYVKVPQFLSDVRYVRNGVKRGRFSPPLPRPPAMARARGSSATKAATSRRARHTYDRLPVDRTKCFYWGSGRRMLGVRFNAGMLFMLHRRLAQVILEPPQSSSDVDLRTLAVADYSNDRRSLYRQAGLHHEDVMIGVTLRNRYNRSMELCTDETIWYVKESYNRFHDLHRGKLNPVTWSTVVAHRCRPADAYFLHYYFQNEYSASTVEIARGDDREEVAIEAAAEWVAEQRNAFSDSVPGWDDLPSVLWTHRASAAPEYVVATGDDVAVYNYSYQYWRDNSTFVWNGYRSSR
ncbi:phosphoglycan beta 1,3 galactosyltransferase [Leishmania major strain Friedlin]|uniref:Phosphoglycan beta 1,3 galactosyltransferase n=1 Tax=Leishmania major TaxID=5664 RepID=E9AC96_LEIMA|nr:phosphoglycan beta 1,3 galactosyltransferase [Leishmania major strain Friedlin]CAG9567172.1 phosphoglycan_beta_1_-3_galactosyltransferase [Leishmania major strain Friedlin]CBZ11911.1 phosphoglycan beta 1,3 galactosyltransferase [Leishmania major strain Friedlin]|eukprot:XP_003721627.1 phosphoglycan beta 1,3 galactosyltransferase [Leishmania major strain Friedlin]